MSEYALDLEGMTCASCAARIEKRLNGLDGVEATVNYAADRPPSRSTPPSSRSTSYSRRSRPRGIARALEDDAPREHDETGLCAGASSSRPR